MKNILVSVDWDVNMEYILDKACEIAEKFDSKLWLLHVAVSDIELIKHFGSQRMKYMREEELKSEEEILNHFANEIKDKGIQTEIILLKGATSKSIIEESERIKADLIVIGHNEHNVFYNLFLGDTSLNIVKSSKIPVLIVPLD